MFRSGRMPGLVAAEPDMLPDEAGAEEGKIPETNGGQGELDVEGAGNPGEDGSQGASDVEETGNPGGDGSQTAQDATPTSGQEPTEAVIFIPSTPFGENSDKSQSESHSWGWLGVGFTAGLALAFAFFGIIKLCSSQIRVKREKESKSQEGSKSEHGIIIEKLHEQGARKSQQDSFSVSQSEMIPNCGLLAVVADGMGGLSDGDRVSQTAVAAMMNAFYTQKGTPEQVLISLLKQANRAVNMMLGPAGLCESGSTLVAGLIRGGAFYYLSVGDSRICLYRDGVLYQLNREHVYRNELYANAVNGSEEVERAAAQSGGSGLTSFLGMGQLKYIDLPAQAVAIRAGDIFVLMSDGVYNALPEAEIVSILKEGTGAADRLRAAIQAKGYANQDNYTAVLLCC